MLYPKSKKEFEQDLFTNPTSEYRGTPFWSWNTHLEEEELVRQIDVLKKMGYGGFHMHVRTGLDTEYLGDEFMSIAKTCVEKAQKEHMLAWLYDEDRWPSGYAGGIVTKNKEFRVKHLLLTREAYGETSNSEQIIDSAARSLRTENGELIACFDVSLNADGSLNTYTKIDEKDEAKGFKFYAYMETATDNPWFNNQAYVDTLNPKAIAEFIRVTYDRYLEYFKDDFGGVVPAIFTDEPQFAHKTTLGFADEIKDVTLPWTADLPTTFLESYHDEDLIMHLPELVWEKQDGVSRIRYLYHDHIAERFASAFADQCGAWCENHGLMLTGHMMEEPTLRSQTSALGDAMRSYRGFQLPGIDMLCNSYEFTTAKQAQSACHQFGNPGVLSELYGVTNWDFDFRGHKSHGDWQAALGVTVRVPHLSWVSMNGEAKRDYPGTFNYQAPWHGQYSYIEDHFARLNTALTRGKPVVRVGVIHPVESYWMHWGATENTRDKREQKDKQFQDVTNWLLLGQIDFDFVAESLFPSQCDLNDISGDFLPVGQMKYEVILVPECETLRSSTLARLERFKENGGRVIFMGKAPTYVDALSSDRGLKLFKECERIAFERNDLINHLNIYRDIELLDANGGASNRYIYQLRKDGDGMWLFIAHATESVNKDITYKDEISLIIRGRWDCTLFDTLSGEATKLCSELGDNSTQLSQTMYDYDSLLIHLEPASSTKSNCADNSLQYDSTDKKRWSQLVPVTLEEPNVLLLDMPEYKFNDEDFQAADEILRIDNILRSKLSWPLRMDAVAQPWVEQDTSTPHTVSLRYHFNSNIIVKGAKLALERPDLTTISLNGQALTNSVTGWYVDKCFKTVDLPDLNIGANTVEVTYQYGRKTDLEAMYIIGDFGVSVQGTKLTITPPVKELAFGDITRQGLAFYGGNIVYHLDLETASKDIAIEATNYRGHLLNVAIDGEDKGKIVFSPYRLHIGDLSPGKHKLDIRYFGNRVNTFGQVHSAVRESGNGYWWGPNSWRTTGDAWSYEYKFWEQGILKSPEVLSL